MAARRAALIGLALVAGCACEPEVVTRTVEVQVPIATRIEPPAELLAPMQTMPPTFVAPGDADALAALTPQGVRELKALIDQLLGRVEQWQAWGVGH